jgi:Domain of unknown function (DUF4279)
VEQWKGIVMTSSRVSQVVPGSTFSYSISLRVRHPSLDPALLTETLHLEPLHSWRAGEPRRSVTGAALGGEHRESYWSAPLPGQAVGAASFPLEMFLAQQLVQLNRHREFLGRLQSENAQISLVIEFTPLENPVLTLSPSVSRKLADLNIEVEFQFVGE